MEKVRLNTQDNESPDPIMWSAGIFSPHAFACGISDQGHEQQNGDATPLTPLLGYVALRILKAQLMDDGNRFIIEPS